VSVRLIGEQATLAAGARLARALLDRGPDALPSTGLQVHLHGPLGAGKTTLVRGLLRALGVTGAVRSPTYTLVEPYQARGLDFFHFDLYRLADPEELELLGAREHFRGGAVCLFEWPERGVGWLPEAHLVLRLDHDGEARTLQAAARDDRDRWLEDAALGPPLS